MAGLVELAVRPGMRCHMMVSFQYTSYCDVQMLLRKVGEAALVSTVNSICPICAKLAAKAGLLYECALCHFAHAYSKSAMAPQCHCSVLAYIYLPASHRHCHALRDIFAFKAWGSRKNSSTSCQEACFAFSTAAGRSTSLPLSCYV